MEKSDNSQGKSGKGQGKVRKRPGKSQRKVREFEKERGKSGKSQRILTCCPNIKVSPLLKFNLIAASAKMLYQEFMENAL